MSSPIFVNPTSVLDVTSARFNIGDVVSVRCIVNNVTGGNGSGARVALTVETDGNVGEAAGVTLSVSPVQCRKASNKSQLSGN